MSLSKRDIEMVAIGASIAGNCIPCLEYHHKKCMEIGISQEEFSDAVAIAIKVKEAPDLKIRETAQKLSGKAARSKKNKSACC